MITNPIVERFSAHANFRRLVELAVHSHKDGRSPARITERDIALARLYGHAFRAHVIGAFHATGVELQRLQSATDLTTSVASGTMRILRLLADRSMDTVGTDARALLSTFHFYATQIAAALESLDQLAAETAIPEIGVVRDRFAGHMAAIAHGNGLHLTQDTGALEQGSFVVPALGITIVPLVYGDFHSWNLAVLDPQKSDVPYHFHEQGVEIHLGYSP